jgi:hypothetical protein
MSLSEFPSSLSEGVLAQRASLRAIENLRLLRASNCPQRILFATSAATPLSSGSAMQRFWGRGNFHDGQLREVRKHAM